MAIMNPYVSQRKGDSRVANKSVKSAFSVVPNENNPRKHTKCLFGNFRVVSWIVWLG
jgi:hypothetical protein